MNSVNFKQGIVGLLMLAAVVLSACVPVVSAASMRSADLTTHPSRGEEQLIVGSNAQVVSGVNGATINVDTNDLEPGHAYTVWFVAIDKPENCATIPCTGKDVFGLTEEIDVEVAYATGAVADEDGSANFFAHMDPGPLPGGWFGNEFTNPNAEIHLVLMSHGPVIEGMEDEMIGTLRGGCTDESVPAPFPAVAHADGEAGPNTCQLFQDVIFVQS